MALEERKMQTNNMNVIQNLVLENREKLSISGVLDVLSFDDQVVIVEGEIYNLAYSENEINKKSGGIFNKIFK